MNPVEAAVVARSVALGCTCQAKPHVRELVRGVSGTWFTEHAKECPLHRELSARTTTTIGRAW